MKAGGSQLTPTVLVFMFNLFLISNSQVTDLQVCSLCSGTVLNDTEVGKFCSSALGRINGRCCLTNGNTSDPEHIIGLDLSNCSLTYVEDLQGASTAFILDLSFNSLVNISDTMFQGFSDLNYMILPEELDCPGGEAFWEKVEVKEGKRLCTGQINMCNHTGQLSITCPKNSLCVPYGPGFFECSCIADYHGYKCLREGEFPAFQVFGPLGASTVAISFLLWLTQRRKVKRSDVF